MEYTLDLTTGHEIGQPFIENRSELVSTCQVCGRPGLMMEGLTVHAWRGRDFFADYCKHDPATERAELIETFEGSDKPDATAWLAHLRDKPLTNVLIWLHPQPKRATIPAAYLKIRASKIAKKRGLNPDRIRYATTRYLFDGVYLALDYEVAHD